MATEITKVALLEHCTISSSSWMIFFIRATGDASVDSNLRRWCYILGRAVWPVISSTDSGASFGDMAELAVTCRKIEDDIKGLKNY